MKTERGSILMAILATVGFVVVAVLFLDLCFDDESEERNDGDDLGAPALVLNHGDRDKGRNSRGDCESSENCQDNDGINADKVILCLPQSTCNFGKGEQASLLPPNPEKLVGAITVMTKAVGDAAGALAGAIAGGTIGILLTT